MTNTETSLLPGSRRGRHPPASLTPEFICWFGKSRVVNPDGSPRAVYHGTASDFVAFDAAHCGKVTDTSDATLGFWFTDSPGRAHSAAEDAAWMLHGDGLTGKNILPVYLRIEHPKVFREELPDMARSASQIIVARAAAHDGIIWLGGERDPRGGSTGPTYLVFAPEQIKSIHNRRPSQSPNLVEFPQATNELLQPSAQN